MFERIMPLWISMIAAVIRQKIILGLEHADPEWFRSVAEDTRSLLFIDADWPLVFHLCKIVDAKVLFSLDSGPSCPVCELPIWMMMGSWDPSVITAHPASLHSRTMIASIPRDIPDPTTVTFTVVSDHFSVAILVPCQIGITEEAGAS